MKKRILIVEDDGALASVLSDNLLFEGFEVRVVSDGHQALPASREFTPDLVILDVMLPGPSGFELCGMLRQGARTPIIMLSARVQKADKLQGLALGADDYVTKPFDMDELLARVRAVLRRVRPAIERLTLGGITVDFVTLAARHGGTPISMTHREFELLRYLAERADRVVYRRELLREIWGYSEGPMTRSVDQAIARLRKKIESDPHHPQFIHTVQGDGYLLSPNGRLDIAGISP
jgi:two-component system response regulator MtrA